MCTYDDLVNDMNDQEWLEFVKVAFPDVDFTLTELIYQADETATWRGHSLSWDIDYIKGIATGDCLCGAGVTVRTHPMPNQIDIGGSAVAINCGDK